MIKSEWAWMFFNEEWNEHPTDMDGGDEDFMDGIDIRHEVEEDDGEDDYEKYGN